MEKKEEKKGFGLHCSRLKHAPVLARATSSRNLKETRKSSRKSLPKTRVKTKARMGTTVPAADNG